jgi:hypothetical protein
MSAPSDTCRLYASERPTYLRTRRLFYLDATDNIFEGWYFKVRGPRYYGPFQSQHEASRALDRMVSTYCANDDTSGR